MSNEEFWMRVAGGSFALWALMIPIGVAMLRTSFTDAVAETKALNAALMQLRIDLEHRLTQLEQRNSLP